MAKSKNPWLEHLAKFRKDNPKLSPVEAMKKAKKTYTPKK